MSETTGHLRVYRGASLVEVSTHYTKFPRDHSGGGKRDKCSGFSAASRKRLMVLLNKIREDALRKAILVTLTYRRDYVNQDEDKQNFKSFRESMRRNFPEHSGIWKLEFQKRGSPHYHLLLFGGYINHTWVADTWNRIAEYGDPVHRNAGTRVESARHARSAASYLTKYLGKIEQTGADTPAGFIQSGRRYWGIIQRSKLPIAETEIIPLRGSSAREIIRYECARRSLSTRGDTCGGVHLFTSGSEATEKLLNEYQARLKE